jgi:hypothetical protein
MTAEERRGSVDQLATIPDTAAPVVLATARYLARDSMTPDSIRSS